MSQDEQGSTAQLESGAIQFLEIGSVIRDRYIVQRVLGYGGMGIVYLAHDRQMDHRLCAIKETHTPLSDPPTPQQINARKGLKLEWDYFSTLNHPMIPRGYDFFAWEHRHYLVMEYIEGDSLAKKLEEERAAGKNFPFDEPTVINWAIQICEIFTYLHAQRPPIYYRDCKPENFILTSARGSAGGGRLRIIDFGIARRALDAPNKHHTALGTRGYAAPESFTGECDQRTDLFSLGVMMHALLTFINPEDIESNEWLNHPPRTIRTQISHQFSAIIMRCLDPDRQRRWGSAAEVQAALKDVLISHPSGYLPQPHSQPPIASHISENLVSAESEPSILRAGFRRPGNSATNDEVIRPPHSVAPDVLWMFKTEEAIHAAPVAAGATILCGCLDKRVLAFSLKGEVVASYQARAAIFADPVVQRRMVYIADEEGIIHALDTALTRRAWTLRTREPIHSSPTILDQVLVVGTDHHHVLGIPLTGGEPAWMVETMGPVMGEMATIGDLVICGDMDGYIHAIDSQGKIRWKSTTLAGVLALPIAAHTKGGNLVIVGSEDRTIYALDSETGYTDWRRHVDGPVITGAAFDGRYIYVGAADGRIYCLDGQDRGEVHWTFNTRSQISSDLVLDHGRLYFGCADGSVFCLHAQRVETLWRHQARGAVVTRPLVLKSMVVVTSKDGRIYALRDATEPDRDDR